MENVKNRFYCFILVFLPLLYVAVTIFFFARMILLLVSCLGSSVKDWTLIFGGCFIAGFICRSLFVGFKDDLKELFCSDCTK